jgi:hypothetical protein
MFTRMTMRTAITIGIRTMRIPQPAVSLAVTR